MGATQLITNEKIANRVIPDGQERLATQVEREDVNRRIGTDGLEKPVACANPISRPHPSREAGDQVNRFLLCALVNESSRHIKARARRLGESLPMSMIVRGVLRSYRLAANDSSGPLAGPAFDVAGLQRLNEIVLKDEIARLSQERVRHSQAKLASAERLGDYARIKVEKTELERASELRDRLVAAFH